MLAAELPGRHWTDLEQSLSEDAEVASEVAGTEVAHQASSPPAAGGVDALLGTSAFDDFTPAETLPNAIGGDEVDGLFAEVDELLSDATDALPGNLDSAETDLPGGAVLAAGDDPQDPSAEPTAVVNPSRRFY